jgi:hypothetical protein
MQMPLSQIAHTPQSASELQARPPSSLCTPPSGLPMPAHSPSTQNEPGQVGSEQSASVLHAPKPSVPQVPPAGAHTPQSHSRLSHTVPQAPQLVGSLDRSVLVPLQTVGWGGQLGPDAQTPLRQVSPDGQSESAEQF